MTRAIAKQSKRHRSKTRSESAVSNSREEILAVAAEEFAERGLSGSRVDEIAERTRTSKRMIYYHFSGKEGLYRAVLDRAYAEIRSLESQLDLNTLTPTDAITRIVELTFDYDENHPQFISLVNVENIHRGANIAKLPSIRKRNASIIKVLKSVLERGVATAVFRSDVSALDLHLFISALCFFRVSNRYTFGVIFDCNLSEPAMRKRHRQMIVDAVLRFLDARPSLPHR
jgi:AcrR family transcriptional regulator